MNEHVIETIHLGTELINLGNEHEMKSLLNHKMRNGVVHIRHEFWILNLWS